MKKKSINLLLISGLFFFTSAQANNLKVVPETFTSFREGEASFLIMEQNATDSGEKHIRVEGLPAGFSWQLTCTGKREKSCRYPASADDLPVYILNIQPSAGIAAGAYSFTISSGSGRLSQPVSVKIDIVDTVQFTHPGILLSAEMLERLRSRTQSSDPLWNKALTDAQNSRVGSLSYIPSPHASVDADTPQGNDLRDDAIAAYTQALLWYITREAVYAENALRIMNSWSAELNQDFTGKNRFNLAAWTGDLWPRAAEIIRYTYLDESGAAYWQRADIERFSDMLKKRYVQFIKQGFFTSGYYGGNLINSQAAALINIGVFNEDPPTFLEGIAKWRRMLPAYIFMQEDGLFPAPPSFWRNNFIGYNALLGKAGYWYGQDLSAASVGSGGITQETCRDLGHVLWGVSALADGGETARIQGFDLHNEKTMGTANYLRLQAAMEFNSTLLNSNSDNNNSIAVPTDLCQGKIVPGSSVGKGEMLFNDLENRRYIPLPQTSQYLEKYRPTRASYFMVWETLSHYRNP